MAGGAQKVAGREGMERAMTDQGVVDRPQAQRFELAFPGGVAFATYRAEGDRLVLTHTEVPAAFNGQGIGSRLAQGMFDLIRASGRKAVIRCSFLAAWLRRHPAYADLIAG
jgi:predicted GNAT family acetyltransferase